jgi:hypothetical protein
LKVRLNMVLLCMQINVKTLKFKCMYLVLTYVCKGASII